MKRGNDSNFHHIELWEVHMMACLADGKCSRKLDIVITKMPPNISKIIINQHANSMMELFHQSTGEQMKPS